MIEALDTFVGVEIQESSMIAARSLTSAVGIGNASRARETSDDHDAGCKEALRPHEMTHRVSASRGVWSAIYSGDHTARDGEGREAARKWIVPRVLPQSGSSDGVGNGADHETERASA